LIWLFVLDEIINADINDLKNLYVTTPSEGTNSFARISKYRIYRRAPKISETIPIEEL
jgi:hypothetical protein